MRLELPPGLVRDGLVTSDNTFELAALQRLWDTYPDRTAQLEGN